MKKYMTVAALLAAGTAFANAVDTSAWETVNFTLVGDNGTNVSGADVTSGRAAFATLNGLTGTFEGYSWELSFTVDAVTDQEKMVYSSFGGTANTGNGSGYAISVVNSDNGYTFKLKEGSVGIASKTELGSIETTSTAVKLVWDSETSTLSFTVGDSEAVEVTASSALSLSTLDQATLASGNAGGEVGPIFWTNTSDGVAANPLSGISLKTNTTIIPEPSAFGLLAGVGALALVAARRRRAK